jgi:hypothetical protein
MLEIKLCIGRKCWIGYCYPILLLVQIKAFGNHELRPTTCFLGMVLQCCEKRDVSFFEMNITLLLPCHSSCPPIAYIFLQYSLPLQQDSG